jgi:hypothetical protein
MVAQPQRELDDGAGRVGVARGGEDAAAAYIKILD